MTAARDNRLSIRLDPDVVRILDQIEDPRQYIEDSLRFRQTEWRTAYALLAHHDWQPAELAAACEALRAWGPAGATQHGVVIDLRDATASIVRSADRWADRWHECAVDPQIASAVAIVAREYWAGNEDLARRLPQEMP